MLLELLAAAALVLLAALAVYRQITTPLPSEGALCEDAPPDGVRKVGFTAKKWEAVRADGPVDVIVVGSGIGGLMSAGLLAKSGKRVVVLEQHDVAGGCTHTYTEKGYEFDTGVHYAGSGLSAHEGCGMLLNSVCARGPVGWAPMDHGYDVAVQGVGSEQQRMVMPSCRRELRAELLRRFPAEERAIERYFTACEECAAAGALFFAGKVVSSLLPSWLAPVARRLFGVRHRPMSARTVAETLNDLTDNDRLRGLLTYHYGNYGAPPGKASFAIHAMVANHYMDGAWYPTGGSSEIARRIIPTIEATGGAVFVRAPVASLLYEKGAVVGVQMARSEGLELRAKAVISAAGFVNTFERLVPAGARPLLDGPLTTLASDRAFACGSAHLSLSVALRGDKEELGLPACNMWITPSSNHDANHAAYAADPEGQPVPAVFLSFPSAKDPSWAARHPGKSTCQIIADGGGWDRWQTWAAGRVKHRGAEYEALKEKLSAQLLQVLFSEFPRLRERVEFAELGTPLTSAFYLGSAHGESYGLLPTPRRFHLPWLEPATPIPGLYMTGSDIVSNGFVGAMISGALTAIAVNPLVAWHNLRSIVRL